MATYGKGVVSIYDLPHSFDMKTLPGTKTVSEACRETPVVREADVIVVGGGPGGVAAACEAARQGVRVLLVERYGHLGGMATGGLVNIIPNLGNVYGEECIGGFCEEFIQRLHAREDAACFPPPESWGKGGALADYYMDANMTHFYVRIDDKGEKHVLKTAVIDPEVGKAELFDMVTEAGAEVLLHTWVAAPIMEDGRVKGVLVETKSGRQALLAKVVIDCTGDGDLLPGTGTEIDDYMAPGTRIAQFGYIYWIAGVDLEKYDAVKNNDPVRFQAAVDKITAAGGQPRFSKGLLERQHGVVWIHWLIGSLHQTDPEEMTFIDARARKASVRNWELLRQYMPGFENSFIMLSCPQLGTSGGRRIVGEYYLTEADLDRDTPFDDTIAVFADNDRGERSFRSPKTYVPYRALVPKGVEGLLVACRAFSADHEFSEFFNLIPHCMCFGHAAGIAAAIAVKNGIAVRDVPYAALREQLLATGAILP